MRLPWEWTRRRIAERWGIPPPLVDLYPEEEINLELELSQLEAKYQ